MSGAQHSAATVEHGTPREVVEMAREVMGGIDIDPCTSDYFNLHVVEADEWYTENRSVLGSNFVGGKRFFINPPGGLVKEFWRFALARHAEGSAVFWVGFSLNQMTYLVREGLMRPDFVLAIPDKRLKYLRRPADDGPPIPGDAPPHGSYLVLMPSHPDQVARFKTACEQRVVSGVR